MYPFGITCKSLIDWSRKVSVTAIKSYWWAHIKAMKSDCLAIILLASRELIEQRTVNEYIVILIERNYNSHVLTSDKGHRKQPYITVQYKPITQRKEDLDSALHHRTAIRIVDITIAGHE